MGITISTEVMEITKVRKAKNKTIFGKKLRSRREDNRHVETVIGCNILNRFLEMGRCQSKMVL